MDMVGHDHVAANPNSTVRRTQAELNERFVYGRAIQDPSSMVCASRDVINRRFREKTSKALRSGHIPCNAVSIPQ
jgi:hypothetical protein